MSRVASPTVLCQPRNDHESCCQNEPEEKIWRLPVPPKIRQFIWRLAHNSLAVKMNLKRRGIILDTRCPICSRFDEDGGHCFIKCKVVRKCWSDLLLEDCRLSLINSSSSEEFVECILNQKPIIKLKIVVFLWTWWNVRNKVNAGELVPSCHETVWSVLSMVSNIQEGEFTRDQQVASVKPCWSPPEGDMLKLNIDGAFIKESKKGAWGFIVRDRNGSPVLAGAGSLGPVHDALMAETRACKKALDAVDHFGIRQLIIETDSCQLKEAITSTNMDLSVCGGLFSSIREFMLDSFIHVCVCKIPRNCNSSAHELARMGLSWDPGQDFVWTDPLPDHVNIVASRDLAERRARNTRP